MLTAAMKTPFSRLAGSRHLVSQLSVRHFSASLARQDTAAEVSRSKEVGAAVETQDVTTMDSLLRVLRTSMLRSQRWR